MTTNATGKIVPGPGSAGDALSEVLRDGAQRMLKAAIEAEVSMYIDAHVHITDEAGHRQVVRNGHHRARVIDTGAGPIEVRVPRVDDRRVDAEGKRFRFTSKILPPYLRRARNLEALVPWLYLKGISTSDFTDCMKVLVGAGAATLSPTTVVRLKEIWSQEYEAWSKRSLAGKRFVYFWADGVYFNVRLEDGRQCILVVMGATADGDKELLAITDGTRESEQSWTELLLDLKQRGLEEPPKLAVGDGALGFWKALQKVFPETVPQRCWVHKSGNVLNCFPKNMQPSALANLQQIWMADTRDQAIKALDGFAAKYEAKYPKATASLQKDRDQLLAFYDFPAEHWKHLRTTNPIESMFATVRLRHDRTKGSGSRVACLAMVFKLAQAAQEGWRRLTGSALLKEILQGVQFKDGAKVNAA
jgi:transposase-like protein